jgi:hypothetical protein
LYALTALDLNGSKTAAVWAALAPGDDALSVTCPPAFYNRSQY